MFSLGMLEILVIAGLAVLLFPPRELPKLARGVARVYGTIRRTADEFKRALLQDEELREPFDEVKGVYDQARWDVRKVEQDARRELAKVQLEARIRARSDQVPGRRVSRSAGPDLPSDTPVVSVDDPASEDRLAGESRAREPITVDPSPSREEDRASAREGAA